MSGAGLSMLNDRWQTLCSSSLRCWAFRTGDRLSLLYSLSCGSFLWQGFLTFLCFGLPFTWDILSRPKVCERIQVCKSIRYWGYSLKILFKNNYWIYIEFYYLSKRKANMPINDGNACLYISIFQRESNEMHTEEWSQKNITSLSFLSVKPLYFCKGRNYYYGKNTVIH